MTKRTGPSAAAMMALCLCGCRSDPAAARQRFVDSGDRFASAGKYAEAAIEYRNALEKDPRAGDVHAKLGEAFLQTGEFPKGLNEYVRAADLRPDDGPLQLKAGQLLLLGGRFDDAKGRADRVLEKNPRDVDAQILVAQALAGLKDLDGAVAQIEDALKLDPDRSSIYSKLGELELSRGKREAAEKAFKQAVAIQPASAAAHLALGTFYWLTGQTPAAEQSLTRAVQQDPRGALANRALASFYLATDRRREAEQPLRTVYEVSKTSSSALALSDYYIALGNDAAATTVLQGLLEDTRSFAVANVRLASIDYRGGRRDAAHRRLDAVLAKDQGNLGALLEKSTLLLGEGKADEALVSASVAAERHADSTAALFTLGRVQAARRQTEAAAAAFHQVLRLNPRATAATIALAQLHLSDGRPGSSIEFAQEALSNDPGNGEARLVLVRGLLQRGELDRAAAELKPLTARFPKSAAVHTLMGTLLAQKKQIAAAKSEFERALQLQPNLVEAVAGLVAIDLTTRDYVSAKARIEPLTASGPTAAVLTLAARTYAASGDLAGAERFLRKAIELDSNYLAAYGALGQLYAARGHLAAARQEFDAIVARSPRSVAALTMTGILFQAEGNPAAARERFESVLKIDPGAAVAANNLAWIYAEQGDNLDVAMDLAQRAQRKLPELADVGDTLGFIYYKKGLWAQAISTLRACVEKDPKNAVYQYHLGLAYAGAGDSTRARQSLTRALAQKADFDGAREARDLLVSLGAR